MEFMVVAEGFGCSSGSEDMDQEEAISMEGYDNLNEATDALDEKVRALRIRSFHRSAMVSLCVVLDHVRTECNTEKEK